MTQLPGPAPTCPACWTQLTAYTEMTESGEPPRTGDATICAYCHELLEFVVRGIVTSVRKPNAKARAEMLADPVIKQTLALMKQHPIKPEPDA